MSDAGGNGEVVMRLGSSAKLRNNSWVAATIVFSAGLLLFSINLDRPPHPDELHHVLAAQHLLETGRPILAEGEYWRGILHTWMVATSYEIFGEGLASARIPAVFLVALVAPILFLWVQREAGLLAAWLTAVLFITSPFTVEIAQFSRMYALQIFFFVIGTMCFYYTLLAEQPLARRVSLGALATVLLVLAIWQQKTTLVGLVGVAAWAFGLVVHRVWLNPAADQTNRKVIAVGLLVTGILIIWALILTDVLRLAWIWERYQSTQLFNMHRQDEYWFYYLRFFVFYPTLWTLVGFFAVLAVVRSPRLAWLAISIFSVSFLLMSFAGTKNTRYLAFAPPFLTIVWGIGLACVLPQLWRYVEATRMRLIETLALPQRVGSIAGYTLVISALSIIVLSNPFWLRTAALIGNVALPTEIPVTDWHAARAALASWSTDADIMITTEELGAIYFLGRSDVRYSASKLQELDPDQRKEFGIDYRTGRPIISRPESLEQLIECFQQGIVVGPIEHWGNPILISEAVQDILEKHAKPIEVPKESYLYAWGWAREFRKTRPSYCSDLSEFSGQQTQ